MASSIFSLRFLLVCASCLASSYACTAIGVTAAASATGTPFLAHTDDAGGEAGDVRLTPVPRQRIKVDCSFEDLENCMFDEEYERHIAVRNVYKLQSGYPRLVSFDRGEFYQPVEEYNGRKVHQEVYTPLGRIPDISPLELLDESKEVISLDVLPYERKPEESFRFGYLDQDYGAMNEMQLSIVESTCGGNTVGWPSDEKFGFNMFGIAELSKVALERCISARCAVKLMGALAEKYGFYSEDSGDPANPGYADSAEALIIADRLNEVWVFHVLTGERNSSAIWAAQRVEDGQLTVLANGFVIRDLDFTPNDSFLFSKDIKSVAARLGLWSSKNDDGFDFTKVFGFNSKEALMQLYVGRRMWRVFDRFAPSLELDATLGQNSYPKTYPFSVAPDEKIHLHQMMEILKDHYEGTPYDMTKGLAAGPFGNPNRFSASGTSLTGGWERPISIWRSLFSFVAQINVPSAAGEKEDMRSILWYGPDKPHGTVYFPFSSDEIKVDEVFMTGIESQFDMKSAWRAFSFVNNWAMVRYDAISEKISEKQMKYQLELIKLVQSHAGNSELAQTRQRIVSEWWIFAFELVASFSDGYFLTGEKPGEMKSLGYPDWWLNQTSYVEWPGNSFNPPRNNMLRGTMGNRLIVT